MSRLLGAAYGVFCMVLLAPPLALMRAGRDVASGWVSMGGRVGGNALVYIYRQAQSWFVITKPLWGGMYKEKRQAAGFGSHPFHLTSFRNRNKSTLDDGRMCHSL